MLSQSEIDSISKEFLDAWINYFGQEMYYVPLIKTGVTKNIYGEVRQQDFKYDYDNKVLFHGTLKEKEVEDKLVTGGKRVVSLYTITFVTKELEDAGIKEIDTDSIIQVPLKSGKTLNLEIISKKQKFQLVNNKIFTVLEVRCYE